MPAKNSIKLYLENGYYHVYNRGVEKRNIFLDNQDFATFLYLLKYYLDLPNPDDPKQNIRTLHDKVDLLAFCLMPNHFHLLIKQTIKEGMTRFLRAVNTSYVNYFNQKYERVGGLFQGKYKAAIIETEPHFIHLSRYIHLNPRQLDRVGPWKGSDPLHLYPYSSYSYYLGEKYAAWIKPDEVLIFFRNAQANNNNLRDILSYQSFVEDYLEDAKQQLGELALE